MLFDLVRLGGMVTLGGMEENKKSASPKKNCAYGKQDSNVLVDKWVNCLFVCLPQALYGGGMTL